MYWFNIWSTLIEHNYSSWIEENQKLEAIIRDYDVVSMSMVSHCYTNMATAKNYN